MYREEIIDYFKIANFDWIKVQNSKVKIKNGKNNEFLFIVFEDKVNFHIERYFMYNDHIVDEVMILSVDYDELDKYLDIIMNNRIEELERLINQQGEYRKILRTGQIRNGYG